MMGLKDLTPLRGQLLPTKTVQETQSEEITGKAYVVEIGIKSASSVLKVLDSAFPRDPSLTTSHLRRFAKPGKLPNYLKPKESEREETRESSSPQTIYVLIPPPLPDTATLQTLIFPYVPSPSIGELTPASVSIQSTRILLQPPTSLEKAEFWSKEFWPTIYNPASHPAAHSPPPATLVREKQALELEAGKYLALAKRVAGEAKELGRGRSVGVVAVDPTLAKAGSEDKNDGNGLAGVIAVAGDARYCINAPRGPVPPTQSALPSTSTDFDQEGGPDKHALMRLIAMIANKRLSETSQTNYLLTSQHTANPKQIPPLSPLESSFLHMSPLHTSHQELKDIRSDPLSRSIPSVGGSSLDPDATPSAGPYLCTSLDIYSTHDPCPCCSMGMILSRFHAVIYLRDETRIGLGGLASTGPSNSSGSASGYGLNWRRELNWRTLGFEFVVDEGEEKVNDGSREEKFHA